MFNFIQFKGKTCDKVIKSFKLTLAKTLPDKGLFIESHG